MGFFSCLLLLDVLSSLLLSVHTILTIYPLFIKMFFPIFVQLGSAKETFEKITLLSPGERMVGWGTGNMNR